MAGFQPPPIFGREPLLPGAQPRPTLRVRRSCTAVLLLFGLGLLALVGVAPALAVARLAPEVARALLVFTGATSIVFVAGVLATRRAWQHTTVEVTHDCLEVRRARLRPERTGFADIRRMAHGPLGLIVWTASGRSIWVGRLGKATPRVIASLETRSGVPVEGRG